MTLRYPPTSSAVVTKQAFPGQTCFVVIPSGLCRLIAARYPKMLWFFVRLSPKVGLAKSQMPDELPPPSDVAIGQVSRIERPETRRLKKIRAFTNLLDRCIRLPGGFRIGIDPIIGLVPGVGDFVATLLSFYLVYQGALLGVPKRIIVRMSGNVLIEAMVGTIPIVGDIFDAIFKANVRNLNLIEKHYYPSLKERSHARVLLGTMALLIVIWMVTIALTILMLFALWSLVSRIKVL